MRKLATLAFSTIFVGFITSPAAANHVPITDGINIVTEDTLVIECVDFSGGTSSIDTDCVTIGWDVSDDSGHLIAQVFCTGGDCLNIGWELVYPYDSEPPDQQSNRFVVCKDFRCFENGWREMHPDLIQVIRDVTCFPDRATGGFPPGQGVTPGEGRCFNAGWKTRDEVAQKTYVTGCIDGDCMVNGWLTPGQITTTAICVPNGFGGLLPCWEGGWDINPSN